MRLRHSDPKQWDVTLQRHHFDTLICAVRWILDGPKGRIPWQAKNQLREIVNSYDTECSKLYDHSKDSNQKELFSHLGETQSARALTG